MKLWPTTAECRMQVAKTRGSRVYVSSREHPNQKSRYHLEGHRCQEEVNFHQKWVEKYRNLFALQVWWNAYNREYSRVMSVLDTAPKNLYGQAMNGANVVRKADTEAEKVADRARDKFFRRLWRIPAVYGP